MKRFRLWVCVAMAACLAAGASAAQPTADDTGNLAKAFAAECAAKAAKAEAAGSNAVTGKEGWLFLASELRYLGAGRFWGEDAARISRATKAGSADPLPAILDFKRQLDAAGVELLIVPAPAKAAIYPDGLSETVKVAKGAPVARLDVAGEAFYAVLRAAGVEVVDLTPVFLVERFSMEGPLFCKQDSHWSGNGCVVAAREIAKGIKDRPWLKDR
ncbi:MAG: hypothetical protein NT049_09985, partial [Planctomycetota bacterium]|nr:hypothetical protein [Planctomycetota bacterium]